MPPTDSTMQRLFLTREQAKALLHKIEGKPTEWPGVNYEKSLNLAMKKLRKITKTATPDTPPRMNSLSNRLIESRGRRR
jgi:hypothetical protein